MVKHGVHARLGNARLGKPAAGAPAASPQFSTSLSNPGKKRALFGVEPLAVDAEELRQRKVRAKRFGVPPSGPNPAANPTPPTPHNKGKGRGKGRGRGRGRGLGAPASRAPPVARPAIVGTSTKLERPYLRLTAEPDPSLVRPPHVLEQSLKLLKEKWVSEHNYAYVCEQMKSIRQDLTVQQIRTRLSVHAYEIHARIAMQVGDLSEFNQCQTQLHELYPHVNYGHPLEFAAYKVLYLLGQHKHQALSSLLKDMPPSTRASADVRFAVQVCVAVSQNNFAKFFQLYARAPNMSGFLLDHLVDHVRSKALATVSRSFFPSVDMDTVCSMLGFGDDMYRCLKFVSEKGGVFAEEGRVLDTRATRAVLGAGGSESDV